MAAVYITDYLSQHCHKFFVRKIELCHDEMFREFSIKGFGIQSD